MHTHARIATLLVSLSLVFAPACDKGGDKKGGDKKGDDKKGDDKAGSGDEGPKTTGVEPADDGGEGSIACGGIAGKPCPDGMSCVDDPGDDCDPKKGGADCIGICEKSSEGPIPCGGFAGTPCPDGMTCADDPSDDCDPTKGGADCMGVCKK